MKIKLFQIFTIFLILTLIHSITFDLTQTDKHGTVMQNAVCNKDTVIDFNFSPDSIISNCGPTTCDTTNLDRSTLRFLNIDGQDKQYTLSNAILVQTPGGISKTEEKAMFQFTFQNNGQQVMVAIPFSNIMSSVSQGKVYEVNMNANSDSSLSFLQSLRNEPLNSTGVPLSSFNYLNQMDYGHFYQVADSSITVTYLLNYFVLSNMKIPLTTLMINPTSFPPAGINYQATGDLLCYGSVSEGLFQTHMRESFPLWTAWIGIFFYWIYYLTTDLNTISCFDKKFENNKWTCWSVYSLHHLGHEQFFTKLSRQSLMLLTFNWSGFILAVLYYKMTYTQGPIMILWAGVIAAVTSLPFPYFIGYFFHTKIYQTNIQKFETTKKMHGHFNKKQGMNLFEKQLDDIEQKLYGLYYWFYVIVFISFVVFWTLAVHLMQQTPRNYYFLMYYWLASLGVSFALQHLIFDPLMTLAFGNFVFYRIRGYYYEYRLGQRFKQLQEF